MSTNWLFFLFASGRRSKVIAIELKYGGHLGFFENNCFISESVTWLEKALIQLAEALYKEHKSRDSLDRQSVSKWFSRSVRAAV